MRAKYTIPYLAALLLTPAQILAQDDTAPLISDQCASDRYTARQVINELGLEPNVEKGYFTETFRDPATHDGGNRSVSTAIYYLLEGCAGKSYWHRVDATEVWHYYAGAPMSLYLSGDDGQPVREEVLGPNVLRRQRPQVVIEPQEWQQAKSHGKWTLVGTTGMSASRSLSPIMQFYLTIFVQWLLASCRKGSNWRLLIGNRTVLEAGAAANCWF